MIRYIRLTILSLVVCLSVGAQHYTGLNGSDYAGSLSILNNPASSAALNQPWELNIIGLNGYIQRNNSLYLPSSPFLLFTQRKDIHFLTGSYDRYFRGHGRLSLLNLVYKINSRSYFAAGINGRGYGQWKTSNINYQKTQPPATSFLKLNNENDPVNLNLVSNSWIEGYLTYGRTLYETEAGILIGGLSLKLMKGSGGAYAEIKNGMIEPLTDVDDHVIPQVGVDYALTRNLERIRHDGGFQNVFTELLSGTNVTFSFDIGFEYTQYRETFGNGYSKSMGPKIHDFKIGVSLMDVGKLNYPGGILGVRSEHIVPGVTGAVLDDQFSAIPYYEYFGDTLSNFFTQLKRPLKDIVLPLPTNLQLYFDKYIREEFYVNAQLSIPLKESNWSSLRQVTETPHLVITPRWEIPAAGVYLPMLVTAGGEFMPGIALRFGPLIAGLHDVTRIGGKSQMDRGGYYFALRIKPNLIPAGEKSCPDF